MKRVKNLSGNGIVPATSTRSTSINPKAREAAQIVAGLYTDYDYLEENDGLPLDLEGDIYSPEKVAQAIRSHKGDRAKAEYQLANKFRGQVEAACIAAKKDDGSYAFNPDLMLAMRKVYNTETGKTEHVLFAYRSEGRDTDERIEKWCRKRNVPLPKEVADRLQAARQEEARAKAEEARRQEAIRAVGQNPNAPVIEVK